MAPIAKAIAKRGEGIHHICLDVENVSETLEEMKERGLQLIDQQPRPGAHHKEIAFVHPKASNGVLIELSQDAPGYRDGTGPTSRGRTSGGLAPRSCSAP